MDNASISSRRPGYTAHSRVLDVSRGQSGDSFMVVGAQRTSGKGALGTHHHEVVPVLSPEYIQVAEVGGITRPAARDNSIV